MAIVINPSGSVEAVTGVPICFSASANTVIPQEDTRYADLPPSGTNWTWQGTFPGIWKRTGGTNGVWTDAVATVTNGVYGFQPFQVSGINATFETPSSPDRFYAAQWGVIDDQGRWYAWYLWKNCGSQGPPCGGPNTDNSRWQAFFLVNDVPVGSLFVNFFEEFRLRSDGTRLHWDWKTGGVWRLSQYSVDIPQTDLFQFRVRSAYNANEVYGFTTYKGSYVGQVPTTWTAPLGGTITGTGNNRCFVSNVPGSFQVCVDSDFDDQVCVDVEVSPLYFEPVDFACGECAWTDEIVQFRSNGGDGGVLTANGGTVIDSLTWQAPSFPSTNFLTYTIEGQNAYCQINVIDRFRLINLDGFELRGLLPGESFRILTNYDDGNGVVEWVNLDCDKIVQPDGTVTIPPASPANCFGALDCTIRCILRSTDPQPCPNLTTDDPGSYGYTFIDVRVITDPVFPTPEQGGPMYVKWKPETPDFRVIKQEFEGGCDETHIRNKVPVYKWTVRYDGLNYNEPCNPVPCCDEEQGLLNGIPASQQSAAYLDSFWNLVYGEYGRFTLIEPRTKKVWRGVRFDTTMERDHINWKRIQSRDFTLVWRPCCDEDPRGGVCTHESTMKDITFPGPPQDFKATVVSDTEIMLTWLRALDNVGIRGYEIFVDGNIIDLGHTFTYRHKGLTPTVLHTYKIRAYDFGGLRSDWSDVVIVGTSLTITESGDTVQEGGIDLIET